MGTKNKLKWALALGVVAIVGVSVGSLGYVYKEVKAFDKVFADGIKIEEIPVGGLTYDEALAMLKDKLNEAQKDKKVIIKNDKITAEIPCANLGMKSDLDEVLQVAFATGHNGNLFEKYAVAKHKKPINLDLSLEENYDAELIKKEVTGIKDKFYIAPVNATINRKSGQFIITEEKIGQALDVAETTTSIQKALEEDHSEQIEVEASMAVKEPKYTTKSFENVQNLIASFSTPYNNADMGRNRNLEVAAANISRTLLPGEVFSLAEQLEPITYEAGYRESNVIVNGKLEKGIGGGVCQVASTLYNAVLLTNLDITMRQNHSLAVSYVPLGRDATYATGSIDFKFQNNLDVPVIIESYCQSNNVYVNIYSAESAKPKYEVKFLSELTEEVPAPETKYVDDPTLSAGSEVVETSALDGKRVKLYKLFYDDNGKLVDKVLENNSYYRPRAAVIKRGTKAAVAALKDTTPKVEAPKETSKPKDTKPAMNEWDDSFEAPQE